MGVRREVEGKIVDLVEMGRRKFLIRELDQMVVLLLEKRRGSGGTFRLTLEWASDRKKFLCRSLIGTVWSGSNTNNERGGVG